MVDIETIDSYLIQMDLAAESLREGIWQVDDPHDDVPPIIVSYEPPIIYLRLKVLDLPERNREELYEHLLRYNADGIAFGAYAIEGDQVLLVDTLRADSVDMPELQASLESLVMAAQQHFKELYPLLQKN